MLHAYRRAAARTDRIAMANVTEAGVRSRTRWRCSNRGLCALDLARAGPPDRKAIVSLHGDLGAPGLEEQCPIEASILLLCGWEDPVVPVADVLDIAKEMTAAKADWQLHAYGHARHAFTFEEAKFPERGVVYDRRADERSWAAMRRHLATSFGEDRAEP